MARLFLLQPADRRLSRGTERFQKLFFSSVSTGAAPPVGVAAVHRHGAENGGDKEAVQTQERPGEPGVQNPQLPQPLHTAAQRRQVMITLSCCEGRFSQS